MNSQSSEALQDVKNDTLNQNEIELKSLAKVEAKKEIESPNLKKLGTRIERIGEMTCLFLSSYKNGKFPICNIGPSIIPMIL